MVCAQPQMLKVAKVEEAPKRVVRYRFPKREQS